ncbi:MauE/DoxX family redox-associated membrane protein [Novosphingobium sp. EMRT-2]|uniref:MauE/DoxX family redox-associated membrane protein n=1 Tax=Novosphingobium sp. EMRT-2 TaxID=2571749 RepID=UPI00267CDFB7|nr:MauE/DoxX family redox-associated membrane protein [Novosphingobium sp. EMRT-2]
MSALAADLAVSGLGMTGLRVMGLAGACGVGLVFVHAGASKLLHRDVLPGVIANYRLLPDALVAPVAAVLPWGELALGLALLAGGPPFAVVPALVLLGLFAGAMAVNIARGRRSIDCGCGRSQLRQTLGWPLVARNIVLMILVALRLPAALPSTGLELAIAIVGGVSLFVLYLLFNAIAALAVSPVAARVNAGIKRR